MTRTVHGEAGPVVMTLADSSHPLLELMGTFLVFFGFVVALMLLFRREDIGAWGRWAGAEQTAGPP